MKILFVCSGNRNNGASEVVQNQYESLVKLGLNMDMYTIKGRGIIGYLKNVRLLKRKLKENKYDLVHAHYSLSGIVASLSSAKPLMVSLMGSDAHLKGLLKRVTLYFQSKSWDATVLKAIEMQDHLQIKSYVVLPNGVNTERFSPMNQNDARKKLKFRTADKILVFIANPDRLEKNFQLAQASLSHLKTNNVKLVTVYNVPNEEIPTYLNAADMLILTSSYEGSVNVIKEAMACNTPIVSTNVGDVQDNITGLQNCFIASDNPEDIAEKIDQVLVSAHRSNGRDQIFKLKLDSVSVANKLIDLYKGLI